MARIHLEDIRAEVEKDGWKVLSQEYVNLDTEMEFLCDEGHKINVPWKKIRQKRECSICKHNQYKNKNLEVSSKKKDKVRVLALDQATHTTGWSIFDGKELIKYGHFESKLSEQTARNHEIKLWLINMIDNWQPDVIGIEGIQFQIMEDGQHSMGITVFESLARLQGVMLDTAYELNVESKVCHTQKWRAHCGVKGRKRSDKKRSMQLLTKEWYDVNVTEDEADAIGIGKYVAETFYKTVEIISWE